MKSKIFILVSIFTLCLFEFSYAQSPIRPSVEDFQKGNSIHDHQFFMPPFDDGSIEPDRNPLGPEVTNYFRYLSSESKAVKSNALPLPNNAISAPSALLTRHPRYNETVHFRGNGSRLDSSYVFVEWLGTAIPFSKIFYTYNEEDKMSMEVHSQGEPYFRILYTYNDKEDLATVEHQHLDWNGEWGKWKLVEYHYLNASQHPDTIATLYWDYSAEDWKNWKTEVFSLSDQGSPTIKSTFYYNEQDGYVQSNKTFFNYNNEGQLLEEIQQTPCFQGSTEAWKNAGGTFYSYATTGDIEAKIIARWETDHWRDTERTIHSYDDFGNLLKEEVFYSRSIGDPSWVPTQREVVSHGLTTDSVSVSYLRWGDQQWVPQWHADSLFDAVGNPKEVVVYSQLCPPLLVPIAKKTFLYSPNGELSELVLWNWDVSENDWISWQRQSFEYSADGMLQIWLLQSKEDGNSEEWVNIYQRLFTYDTLSLLAEKVGRLWSDGVWLDDGLTTFHYDSLLQLSDEIFHYWDGETWKKYSKNTFVYDQEGNLKELMDWTWSYNGAWYWKPGAVRFAYGYDDFGRQVLEEIFIQDFKIGEWEIKFRIQTQYDALTGQPVERNTEEFKLTHRIWKWEESYQHFWNETITPTAETVSGGLDCWFANPYKLGSTISCEGALAGAPTTLSVYDLMGRLRYQTRFAEETRLEGQVTAGSYILVVSGPGGILFREKLIVP